MGHEIYDIGKKNVRVGNPIKYAMYQELGTRYQPARPFLAPAVYNNKQDIIEITEDVFREVMK
jgi:HK97 gp10 family phage protein